MNHLWQGTPIAGLIILVFVVIAMLEYTKQQRLRKKNNLLNKLSAIAEKNGIAVSQSDIFGDHVLGYDEQRRAVFFFYAKQNDVLIFEIENIADCGLQKSITGNTINTIDLYLKSPYDRPGYTLPLYSRFHDAGWQRRLIMQRAEKWKAFIEGAIIEKKLTAIRNEV
jgi:hypothetical protein